MTRAGVGGEEDTEAREGGERRELGVRFITGQKGTKSSLKTNNSFLRG